MASEFDQLLEEFITYIESNILDNTQQLIVPSKHREVLYKIVGLQNYFNENSVIMFCDFVVTSDISLSLLKPGYVISGDTLSEGDIVLVTSNVVATENGPWEITASPSLPARPSIFDTPFSDHHGKLFLIKSEVPDGNLLYIFEWDDPDLNIHRVRGFSSDLITDTSVISNITNPSNWSNGQYTGSLSGLYQDNYYIYWKDKIMYKYDGTHLVRFRINTVI